MFFSSLQFFCICLAVFEPALDLGEDVLIKLTVPGEENCSNGELLCFLVTVEHLVSCESIILVVLLARVSLTLCSLEDGQE